MGREFANSFRRHPVQWRERFWNSRAAVWGTGKEQRLAEEKFEQWLSKCAP